VYFFFFFFIGKQKVVLFSTFRKKINGKGREAARNALRKTWSELYFIHLITYILTHYLKF